MVSVLDSGASAPGSSPGRRHCVVFLGKTPTVQPNNNARARSGARSSCAARTRKRQKEVKLRFIRKKFQTQEVQNPIRKKPQEVQNPIRKKPQEVTSPTANRK